MNGLTVHILIPKVRPIKKELQRKGKIAMLWKMMQVILIWIAKLKIEMTCSFKNI